MSAATLALAFLAGALSTLSPCVLPLVPIVVSAAATEHRFAPLALAGGLALSFSVIGLFVATIGFSLGIDADLFRSVAALVLIVIGVILLLPALQEKVTMLANPIGSWASQNLGRVRGTGMTGQFLVGLLLGAVWSPCAGPTLGAASVLASQGRELATVAATMTLFGIGAALPLLLIGMMTRESAIRARNRLISAGRGMRIGMGATLAIIGIAIITGADKTIEAILLNHSPDWLTRITTSI